MMPRKSAPRAADLAAQQHPIVQFIDMERISQGMSCWEYSDLCNHVVTWYGTALIARSIHNAIFRVERALKPLGYCLKIEKISDHSIDKLVLLQAARKSAMREVAMKAQSYLSTRSLERLESLRKALSVVQTLDTSVKDAKDD